ncbi:urease accessory protein UreD [Falsigemmobacter intermedius]|uniref:Urease accessory protein UreD n=1 Tax=Falsigemmobacter intermedius TaxID=1553448 RepID=A0A444M9H3_9RHOB|nr:urease accessory protein UreD [Falsigemmobacter intermedius]RWY39547.1 urease accessory protein UreD [Falsigemmobacter intermedius]
MSLITAPLFPAPPRLQRSFGEIRASFEARSGVTYLSGLRQAGSARAISLPGPELVILNTSGGLTGGDRQEIRLTLGAGTRVTATTQTAERVYKSPGGQAEISLQMSVGEGARLDWLPQETILFERSAAHRRTQIDLAPDASCLSCETVILGRTAMGEVLSDVSFRDERLFTRAGRPVHFEPMHLNADALRDTPAGLAGARVLSGTVLLGQGAEDAIGPVRAALDEPGVQGAASGFDGRLVVRLMARDNWPLRRQLIRLLTVLRPSPLPRVWHS